MVNMKKEYTPAEIRDMFIAVNEELKKNGYTYYQLPSASLMQVWDNGKLVPYYPDIANISYPAVEGPKGSITDYKNPNFDEALLRKFTDAKSLSDQLQQKISTGVRSAMSSATDPSKVDVSAIATGMYNSPNGGGKGFTLSSNDPQKKASSMKISSELRRADAPINKYGTPPRIDTDGLSIEAVRNNDADNIVALRKVWGAQPASGDTGLDPNSDEYQYLSRKKGIETSERMSAGAYKSTVAENEASLTKAWADFKAVNDELKAKGYSYLEAKDGMYGTAVSLRGSYYDYLNKVEGPKGDINNIYGATAEGVIVNPIGNPTSPQFDKSLSDLKNKFNQNGPHIIASASSGLAQAQSFEDLEAKLVAKGVDLVKLEQDNPYSAGFGDNQQTTFGAKAPTGQTNLPQTVGTQNENDILAMGGQAGRRIVGDKGTRRGGGTGVSPMQANTASSSTVAPYVIDPIQAQTNAMNAGTWKPSDGYYFSSPNGIGFDPTGKVKDIIDSHPLMSGNNSPEPDNQKALKDAGYSYMTGLGNDTMVVGPKGPYNVGWTSDPAKKGDYQKDLEKIWESSGVTFSQQASQASSLASAPTATSLSASAQQPQAGRNAFIATGVQPPQQPTSSTGFDPSTVSIVTNANSGAVLPHNQTVKPVLVPDKNGNLVPASTTKGGAIGAPGSTASPYAQTTVPSFATKDTYTQKSPRQYP